MLNQDDIKHFIQEFKINFSEYELTDIKILDYIIWSDR